MISGTIAYYSREDHGLPGFTACLARLIAQHPGAHQIPVLGDDIAQARNQAIGEMRGDWIWFVDFNMLFAPDTIQRLLCASVDVCQVHSLLRHPPHPPVLYTENATTREAVAVGKPRLVEVQACGAEGTLYKRKCFDVVPAPWFEGPPGAEGLTFAKKLRAAGLTLHVDLSTIVGNITPVGVWPVWKPEVGEWGVRYELMTGHSVLLPAAERPQVLV